MSKSERDLEKIANIAFSNALKQQSAEAAVIIMAKHWQDKPTEEE